MYARIRVKVLRLPLLAVFVGVAFFIWLAENIGTWGGAWAYPDQVDGWQMVSISKLGSWFLLMIISVVLVTFVYPPRAPDAVTSASEKTEALLSSRRGLDELMVRQAPDGAAPPGAAATAAALRRGLAVAVLAGGVTVVRARALGVAVGGRCARGGVGC